MSIETAPSPPAAAEAPATAGCPVCGGAELAPTTGGLVACERCTHVHRPGLEVPTNEVFESDDYVAWRASSTEHRRIAAARAAAMAPLAGRPGRFLELGCSTGEVVAEMAARGWEAYGLDLSTGAVAAGTAAHPAARLGVGTAPGDAGFPARHDLIAAFHLVEHVPDLIGLRQALRAWLEPGGLLHLRVPNWGSWSRRVGGERWPALMPEHVHQFTAASMWRWLSDGGFAPIDIATEGRAREWLGAARRLVSRREEGSPTTSALVAGPRRLRAVRETERWARPWFALEERRGAGSELVVSAWVR